MRTIDMTGLQGGGATRKTAPDSDLTISHSLAKGNLSPKPLKKTCHRSFDKKIECHPELDSGSITDNRLRLGGRSDQSSSKAAFTMAEVLITLGIIGIVAAMTLPSLIGRWKDKEYEVRAKRSYSLIMQAIERYKAESGVYDDLSGLFELSP